MRTKPMYYREKPVDIETFITDIGYLAIPAESIYPYWMNALKRIYPESDTTKTNLDQLLLTGPRGIGKTTIGTICFAYNIYRLMCLNDPCEYMSNYKLNKARPDCIYCAIISNNLRLATQNYEKFLYLIKDSPWFNHRGYVADEHIWQPKTKGIKIIVTTDSDKLVGKHIHTCLMDEFGCRNIPEDTNKATTLLDRAILSHESSCGNMPNSLMILCGSRTKERASLDSEFISYGEDLGVVTGVLGNKPAWEIKPKTLYNKNSFKVVYNYHNAAILEPNKKVLIDSTFRMVDVPLDFIEEFKRDLPRAMSDFVGVIVDAK